MKRATLKTTNKPGPFRWGRVLFNLLAGTACIGLFVVLVSEVHVPGAPAPAAAKKRAEPTLRDASVMMHRVGLSPEALAAAGLSFEYVDMAGQAMLLYLIANQAAVEDAQATLASARRAEAASRKAGLNRPDGVQPLATAIQAVRTAEAAMDAQLAAAFDFAVAPLPQIARERLALIRTNMRWEVPPAYKLTERTEAQWASLRSALAARRIAQSRGASVPGPAAAILSQVEGDGDVTTALGDMSVNLPSVRNAWVTTFGTH